jgi:hypothetical protein
MVRTNDRSRRAPRPAGYVVLDSLPGYMPDNEPFLLTTRRDAEEEARRIADDYRESNAQTDPEYRTRVVGSARYGGYQILHGPGASWPGTVWRIVEIIPLSAAEAAEYRDGEE